uniref:ATP synthase F0 subunit 8 n=1 Tax=Emmelichthys papillatus TaxID=3139918 RepID=UPI00315CFA8D
MPQLNTSRWLYILMFVWLVFATLLPSKILGHKFPNDPSLPEPKKVIRRYWSWPWR